jgi:hypothetical protein
LFQNAGAIKSGLFKDKKECLLDEAWPVLLPFGAWLYLPLPPLSFSSIARVFVAI